MRSKRTPAEEQYRLMSIPGGFTPRFRRVETGIPI